MSFTDKELALAAASVRDSMLSALPEYEPHAFSEGYTAKIARLCAKMRRREKVRPILQAAAMWFLVFLTGAAIYVASSPAARAAVLNWTREVFENSIIYRFYGDRRGDTLPRYELTWLPEGFELVDEFEDETFYNAFYLNESGDEMIVFDYRLMEEGTTEAVFGYNDKHTIEKVTVNGYYGEIYLPTDGTDNVLTLMDEKKQVVLSIESNLESPVILLIAESIKLCNPTN